MALHNWFIPHKQTHQKAHLISWEGLVIYILIFILLQVSLSIFSFAKPGILGIASNIDQKKVIELTNIERQRVGLPVLSENSALDKAAVLKAQNMFAENYWAHFAPSGKTPWDFILGAGYKFTFAGENLAKNFYASDEVVKAWMASPTHRDNLLNAKYKDIGIAVVDGTLNGQKTTLVVQEFGTTESIVVKPVVNVQGKEIAVPKQDFLSKPDLLVPVSNSQSDIKPLIDPYQIYKSAGLSLIVLMVVLLTIDIWVLRRRGVFRISSHHIAHMSLLALAAGSIYASNPGAVLGDSIPGPAVLPDSIIQMISTLSFKINILLIGIIVYLVWALIHHKRSKSLALPILLEYFLTAVLVIILLLGVIV